MITAEITAEEEGFVDRVFDGAAEGDHLDDAKWAVGITLLAGVLLRKDERERERKLNSLWREIRDAIAGIPKISVPGKMRDENPVAG